MLPLLILVYLGGWFIWAAALIVAVLGVREFYKGFEASGAKPCYSIAYGAIALLYVIGAVSPHDMRLMMIWVVLVTAFSMVYGFSVNERKLADMTSTLLGIMYVVFFSYHIVLIDQSQHRILIWLVFLTAFGTDIMAYFTGMAFGKHKLCPNLSPKKSVEGSGRRRDRKRGFLRDIRILCSSRRLCYDFDHRIFREHIRPAWRPVCISF